MLFVLNVGGMVMGLASVLCQIW
ncbi:hypothetical protein LINPERHAP1_LOCUS13195 [Linum perenne]